LPPTTQGYSILFLASPERGTVNVLHAIQDNDSQSTTQGNDDFAHLVKARISFAR